MDKSPFQNEEVSQEESNTVATNNAIVDKTKPIDLLSIPQKKSVLGEETDHNSPATNEQQLDEDWLLLSQDWQTQPFEKTDIQALLKQTKNRTLLAKLLLILNIIATSGLIITLMVGLYQGGWDTATIAYLAFGCIGSLVFVYYEIKIRLRIWQQSCDSPDKAITNAISGIESSIKYIKLTKLSFWLLLPAVNCYLYVMFEASEKSPWPSFVIMNSAVAIGWFITHWFHLKRNEELTKFSSI